MQHGEARAPMLHQGAFDVLFGVHAHILAQSFAEGKWGAISIRFHA